MKQHKMFRLQKIYLSENFSKQKEYLMTKLAYDSLWLHYENVWKTQKVWRKFLLRVYIFRNTVANWWLKCLQLSTSREKGKYFSISKYSIHNRMINCAHVIWLETGNKSIAGH